MVGLGAWLNKNKKRQKEKNKEKNKAKNITVVIWVHGKM